MAVPSSSLVAGTSLYPLPDFYDNLQSSISTWLETNNEPFSPSLLLRLLMFILDHLVQRGARLLSTCKFGLMLFSDRFLIHKGLLSRFLRRTRDSLDRLLETELFRPSPVPNSQFITLTRSGELRGSRFDWRVYCYPDSSETEQMLGCIRKMGAESFFFTADYQSILAKSAASCSTVACGGFGLPPSDNPRLKMGQMPMEEVLRLYATDPPAGKCWLLYQDDGP
jgi:hypothetical protein